MINKRKFFKKVGITVVASMMTFSTLPASIAFADNGEGAGTETVANESTDEHAQGEETEKVNLEAGKSYKVKVDFTHANGTGDKSMSEAVVLKDGEIYVDEDGKAHITIHTTPAIVMGKPVYGLGVKLYKEGVTTQDSDNEEDFLPYVFTLKEDHKGICQFELPNLNKKGQYRAMALSNIMSKDIQFLVDWSSLKDNGTVKDELKRTVEEASKVEKGGYDEESFSALQQALTRAKEVEAKTDAKASEDIEALNGLNKALAGLQSENREIFEPNKEYFTSVESDLSYAQNFYEKQVKIVTDGEGNPSATVIFKPTTTWQSSYKIREITPLDKQGNPINSDDYTYTHDGDGNGVLTFKLPYVSKVGKYDINVKGYVPFEREEKQTLTFDFANLKEAPDQKALKELVQKAEAITGDDYTELSFGNLKKAIRRAKEVLGSPITPFDDVRNASLALQNAIDTLRVKGNEGIGNTFNLGISGIKNPLPSESAVATSDEDEEDDYGYGYGSQPKVTNQGKPWIGSRVVFGDGGKIWRVLDNKTMLLYGDNQVIDNIAFFNRVQSDDDDYGMGSSSISPFWDDSNMKTYLNGEYLDSKFNATEKSAIKDTTLKINKGYGEFVDSTGNKVYVLSRDDLRNNVYGFGAPATRKISEDPTYKMVSRTRILGGWGNSYNLDGFWGSGDSLPMGLDGSRLGGSHVVPALNLDATKVLMTRAADVKAPNLLTKALETKCNLWKLTLIDDTNQFKVDKVKFDGNHYYIDYSGNKDGDNQLSVIVVRGNEGEEKIAYYGKLMDTIGEAGSSLLKLPDDFNKENDKVYVFSEKETHNLKPNIASNKVLVNFSTAETIEKQNGTATSNAKVVETILPSLVKVENTDDYSMGNGSIDRDNPATITYEKGKAFATINFKTMSFLGIKDGLTGMFVYEKGYKAVNDKFNGAFAPVDITATEQLTNRIGDDNQTYGIIKQVKIPIEAYMVDGHNVKIPVKVIVPAMRQLADEPVDTTPRDSDKSAYLTFEVDDFNKKLERSQLVEVPEETTGAEENPSTTEEVGKTDTPSETGEAGKTENPSGTGETGKTETPSTTGEPGKTENPSGTGEAGKTENPSATGETGKTEKPSETGEAGKTEKPSATGEAGKTDKPSATGETGKTEKPSATGKTENQQASAQPSSKITLEIEKVNSPADAVLKVLATSVKAEFKPLIEGLNPKNVEIYEVNVKGGINIETAKYSVTLPVDESRKLVQIIHIKDRGKVEIFNPGDFTIKDGQVTFETVGLSPVIQVYADKDSTISSNNNKGGTSKVSTNKAEASKKADAKSLKTGDTTDIGIAFAGTAFAGILALIFRKKKAK